MSTVPTVNAKTPRATTGKVLAPVNAGSVDFIVTPLTCAVFGRVVVVAAVVGEVVELVWFTTAEAGSAATAGATAGAVVVGARFTTLVTDGTNGIEPGPGT